MSSTYSKSKGFTRIYKAMIYSFKGIVACFRHEAAFRQEAFLAAILIPLAFWLDVTPVERILMVSVVVLILVVELLNSAIEAVVDRVGEEHHELSGRAKDIGSAAVFVCLVLWAYIWGSILFF